MLKKFLHDLTPDSSIEIIEQKYLIPGHSYNSCDLCFGVIEKKRKKSDDLIVPDDWVNLIKEAKTKAPPFHVTVMGENDFVSSAKLEQCIVNRKKDTDGEKINWLKIRTFAYRKDDPFHVYVLSNDGKKRKINMKKKGFDADSLITCNVATLYPGGRAISTKKYNDLMQLLKYVPQEKHDFFINLQKDESEDYGFASDDSSD